MKQELDALDQELNEVRVENQQLERICAAQETKLNKLTNEQGRRTNLAENVQVELDAMTEKCQRLERAVYDAQEALSLQQSEFEEREQEWITHMQSNPANDQKVCTLEDELKLLRADKNVIEEDAERMKCELSNLESVMQQLQSDHTREVGWGKIMEILRRQHDTSFIVDSTDYAKVQSANGRISKRNGSLTQE